MESTSSGDPRVLASLRAIEVRLARMEQTIAPLKEAGALPNLAATAVDIADEWASRTGDVDARVTTLAHLVERLTRPQTLGTLQKIVELAEGAPDQMATLLDIMDEMMATAQSEGLELHLIVENLKRLIIGSLRMATSPELRGLLDSGMLDPKALGALGLAARAVADANETEPRQVGAFGALRALRRPHTRRALGFAMRVAENLGAQLQRTSRQLPSQERTGQS